MAGLPSIASLRGGVNPVLSDQLAGLVNDPANFIAAAVVPPRDGVAVNALDSGTIITSAGLFGDGSTPLKRARGASNNKTPGNALSSVTYTSVEYNISDELDEADVDAALIDLLDFATEDLFTRLAIQREKDLHDLLVTAANWTTHSFAATAWTDAGADPFKDISEMVSRVGRFGRKPNTVYMSHAAFKAARENDAVRTFMDVTGNRNFIEADVMKAAIAASSGVPVERVYVQDTSANSANAGQDLSVDYLSGSSRFAWLGYIDTNARVVRGRQGLTMRPSAVVRVLTKAPEVRNEEISRPFVGQFILARWREALTKVNEQLGGLITC